jgi:Ni,Fe-hydrogenase maturation factor
VVEVIAAGLPSVQDLGVQERPVRVLVVGYGSSLRCDDAVGQRVAKELCRCSGSVPALGGAKFVVAECLTPELAEDLAGSGFAILADAAFDGRPAGTVTVEPVTVEPVTVEPVTVEPVTRAMGGGGAGERSGQAAAGGGGGQAGAGCWEGLTPMMLLALARDLYGNVPEAVVVSVGIEETSIGEGLSAVVEAAVPRAASAAVEALRAWGANFGQSAGQSSTGGTSTMR